MNSSGSAATSVRRRSGVARVRRSVGAGLIAALTVAFAVTVTVTPATPARAQVAGLDYIEVTSTCTLAKAIMIANANGLARATNDCPGIADGTTTIRITSNSGTAVNPLTGASSAGVQLDAFTTGAGDQALGGTKSILPTIVGDVTIEGDPTGVQPVNGYSIYSDAPPSTIAALGSDGHRLFAVYGALGGSLTLRNLNIGGGRAAAPSGVGAAYGGAIYAQGPLTLDHVTLVGNHAGGGTERDCGYPVEFCDAAGIGTWAGRPGAGGAVYATGSLTVRSSVFESNTATGGSGDDGGAALGGAIGLGDTATATISDSIFVSNVARGGSGAAGTNGSDGADGRNGGNGTCLGRDVTTYSTASIPAPEQGGEGVFNILIIDGVDEPFGGASGGDGEGGTDGTNGTNGGDGGDAVGVISGGASVSIDHSSFVDNDAIAGAAGVEGLGGLGGDGGDGGDGVVCGSSRSAGTVIDVEAGGIGLGGWGGNGGDNGASGTPGARATAVATVRSATTTLVNVTAVGGSTQVVDDNFGPLGEAAWRAGRAQRLDPGTSGAGAGGAAGTAVTGSGGVPGLPGGSGSRDTQLVERERAAGLGRASVIETTTSTASSLRISFSTFADIGLRLPVPGTSDAAGNAGLRGNQNTPVVFTASSGRIKGSLLWNPDFGGAGCASLASAGWNVFGGGCKGEAGTVTDRARDVTTPTRPVVDDTAAAGVEIRPTHSNRASYRMPVLPLERGSVALDTAPFGVGGGSGPCQVLGASGATFLLDDGGRSARPGGVGTACDSGAFEDDGTDPDVRLAGNARAYTGSPGRMTATVPRNPGAGTSLVLRVEGVDGVDFPDGFVATAGDATPDVSEATIPLAGGVTYPVTAPFTIDPVRSGVATITATILGATGGTTTATASMSLVNDGQILLTAEAPKSWRACQGYLPITYTATSVGRSPAPGATVRVLPNAVYPDSGNGLTTPPGEASSPVVNVAYASGASTVAVSAIDDTVIWQIPALGPKQSVTLKTYVYVGRIVNSTDGSIVGTDLRVGSLIDYASGAMNTPLQPFDPIQGSVRVISDIAALGGTLAGAEADPSVAPVLKAGQSGTLYGTLDPGACAAPTDKHDWGYTHVTVRDHATGAVLAEYDTQNLRVDDNSNPSLDGNPWFPIPMTAPSEPGIHVLDFVYNSVPTNDVTAGSVVLEMPYVVEPVRAYLEGDTSAPEATPVRTFKVNLDHPATEDVTLDWRIVSGTAQVGTDLPALSGNVKIPAGDTEASITLSAIDDAIPEQDEYFSVVLSPSPQAPLPAVVQLAGPLAFAYIEDDDGIVPTALTPSPDVTIPTGGSVTPSVTMSAGDGPMPGMPVTLQVSADGVSGWADVAPYLTQLQGVATSAALTPIATTYYRWVFAGSGRFEASTSAPTRVTVVDEPPPPSTAPPTTAPPTTAPPTTAPPTTSAPPGGGPTPSTLPAPSLTSSSTYLSPGATVTLTASGYQPGETLEFVLRSDPVVLGTAVAGGDGTAIWTGTLPEAIALGSHLFIATGLTSGYVATLAVAITGAPAAPTITANPTGATTTPTGHLPETGTNISGFFVLAGLLLGVGLVLFSLGRRRLAVANAAHRARPRRSGRRA